MTRKFTQILINYSMATVGLAIVALGVALSIISDLGTSPVSCLPYVLNLKDGLSVGTLTALMHLCLIIIQIIVLRKRFKWENLMQIVAAIVFGALTDLCIWATSWIVATTYLSKLVIMVIAIVLTAFGISMEVRSHAWMLAGEMTVDAFAQVTGAKFRNVKIIFDSSLVVISAALALIYFHNPLGNGESVVIREGTLAFAIFTGLLMRLTDPLVDRMLRKIID